MRAPLLRCSAPRFTARSIARDQLRGAPLGEVGVAGIHRVLETAELGLDRRRVAAILEPLTLRPLDALFLRGDVGHERREPRLIPATAAYYSGLVPARRQRREPPERPAGADRGARRLARRRLALSTLFFSAATGVSRIVGLVREVVAANYFGVTGPMSAFTIAFQVPNLVRALFADAALQGAFVPVFTELLEKGRKREALHVASEPLLR